MQIILMEKVQNVGNLGEVVKVRDGFARNFLIPQGKARRATPGNLELLESKRADLEKAASEKLALATAQAEKLAGTALRIVQKAGVDGRLFGSVSNVDIVELLKAQGFAVEKSSIRMPSGPLKQVGEHPVGVALHTDVVTDIVVQVIGDTGNA